MGRRGPKAQDAAVASQKAAVRSKREKRKVAPPAQPAQANGVRKPPAWLKDRGVEIWNRLAPSLTLAKLLTASDELAFARYCRNFATWLDLRDKLDTDGYSYEAESYAAASDKKTTLRRLDPNFMVSDRLERQLLAAEDRFGLNPSERQRIMVARAASGYAGDLFGAEPGGGGKAQDPATPAAPAAAPIDSPVGLLN